MSIVEYTTHERVCSCGRRHMIEIDDYGDGWFYIIYDGERL